MGHWRDHLEPVLQALVREGILKGVDRHRAARRDLSRTALRQLEQDECPDTAENRKMVHFVGDFLQQERAPADCSAILTNPPYKLAAQFAEHALALVPDVYLLLRLAFLERVSRMRRRPECSSSSVLGLISYRIAGLPPSGPTDSRRTS
jgi:hypothetical protein